MRRATPKRKTKPDAKYKSVNIGKFTNYVMERGKKTIAQGIVYGSFDVIAQKTKKDPLDVFDAALKNISPDVEVKTRRVGGANYQVPIAVMGARKSTLALRWLIESAKQRKGMPMKEKLAVEIMDAANRTGTAMKKKETVYKMAESNRAFAHFGRFRKKKK
jgi:small subunit ribosomal protein S7